MSIVLHGVAAGQRHRHRPRSTHHRAAAEVPQYDIDPDKLGGRSRPFRQRHQSHAQKVEQLRSAIPKTPTELGAFISST